MDRAGLVCYFYKLNINTALNEEQTTMDRKYIASALLICLALLYVPMPALSAEQNTQIEYLENGLTVMIIPDERFPLVSLRLYVHAGSGYENRKIAGISHALEHMVFKGTENYPKSGVSETIESLGGYFNAYTTFDHTCYLTDLPDRGWKEGLKVLKDMAFSPALEPEDMKTEMEVIVEEIQRGKDNPGGELFRMVQTQAFKDTSYGWPIIGFEDTVRSFKSADLRRYIDAHYKPNNMLLLICGKVDAAAAFKEAQGLFGDIKSGQVQGNVPSVDLDKLRQKPVILTEGKDLNQIYLSFAFPVPGVNTPDEAGLEVLAQLLGGDATSYLYRKYKYDLRLVDQISAGLYTMEGAGLMYFSAVLKPENLAEFWKTICADMADLSAAFTTEDLARAKLNLEDQLFRSKETLAGLASKEGYFYFLGGGEGAEGRYLDQIRSVSENYLQTLIDKYFVENGLTAAVLTPKDYKTPDLDGILKAAWRAPEPETPVNDASVIAPGKPEVVELGEGRTLILLRDDTLPYTSLDIVFNGGNSLLSPDEQGLAALSASVLTMATRDKSNDELERFLSDRAASLSAGAGRHTTKISASFPSRFSNDILPLITEVLTTPGFGQDDLERARDSQLAAIKASTDQPTGLMFRELYPFLFKDDSYGYYLLGTPDGVSKFTTEDLRRAWDRQCAHPWTLAVCGQFNRERILQFAQSLPAPTSGAEMPAAPTWGAAKELDLRLPGRNQTHILLLFKTVPDSAPDAPGLELLQTALSGMSGPLFLRLREQEALAYSVDAMNWSSPLTGFMAFYIGTSPDKEKQALDGFYKIINELHKAPLLAADLTRAANQMEGAYYRNIQALGSRSSEAATLSILNRPLTFATDNIAKAKSLTPEDLRKLAEKYLNPEEAYLIRVDPAENQ